MFGYEGKKRFTLNIPGIGLVRYGTCERDTDDWRDLWYDGEGWWIRHWTPTYGEEISKGKLPEGTQIANGFYDTEHDEFLWPDDFVFK